MGVFFQKQTPAALPAAVRQFLQCEGCFRPEVLRRNAECFSRERFKREIEMFVNRKWMSGHFFFADEYFGFDDAPYAAARLLRILGRSKQSLSGLLADIPRLYSTPETRIPCEEERKGEVVKSVVESFRREGYEVIDVDGARVQFPSGWGLVRASNTQPVLVARCEARSLAELEEIADKLKNTLICAGVKEFQWVFPVEE
ncbi:hypothetical protein [Desulfofundulus kuznetsovii]|uniref:hypothetical protein n=1 Tax=Desulfofundulus kuznetsovii TaxID=58135 RepID=UPI0002D85587